MSFPSLFTPLRLGPYLLAHRIVMAPLTRLRAGQPDNVPGKLNAEYYRQRASRGGLVIAEASQVSPSGQGLPGSPGIHSAEQVEGWKLITEAVHERGGLIFLQLWHVGRISHSSIQPGGLLPVAPSAIAPAGNALTASFERVPYEKPRALETHEIPEIIESYRRAAHNAITADFDGVEIHAANGYLLEQFLQTRTNQRTDAYGGSIENRTRLLLEVTEAVVGVVSSGRVGVRLSPFGRANDSGEADPVPLYTRVIRKLARLDLAYLHLIEPRASGAGQSEVDHQDVPSVTKLFRSIWPGVLIPAGNFTGSTANAVIADGYADAVAFGRAFIANPDLPQRLERGAALNPYDRNTFYGGGAAGYTDYPALLV